MSTSEKRSRGRTAFEQRRWAEAFARLSAADRQTSLDADDLERLAKAAYLSGRNAESADLWARAHHQCLECDDVERAIRCAFWLASGLLHDGELARANGWLARAGRLLEECARHCVEHGYLLLPTALQHVMQGDAEGAYRGFSEAAAIAEQFGDSDLAALACHGRGRVLIRLGQIREGVALLDEAMVAVEAGEVTPLVAGEVYCSVIEGCVEIFDLRRAAEWTAALSRWCDAQPELVPYRGQCMVRRAEILQLHGEWPDALDEAERARVRLARPPTQRAIGAAFYQKAEVLRLQGEFVEAEACYREASQWGRRPEPGLAQLRLAQGQLEAAEATIRRAVEERRDPLVRARLLPAFVEVMLAAGDLEAARPAAAELTEIAEEVDASLLVARACDARGAVLFEEGNAQSALMVLRRAWLTWQELGAPYDAARTRVLVGLACRALGDDDGAAMEFDAARCIFERLGAEPDLVRLRALTALSPEEPPDGLTEREVEVLRHVATGKTNRAIAEDLFISERTVERHVSNILGKLQLPSRAAATAYAYEHGLATP
jgi:DNA-binding CsgD family transcriptional regulator/tetratricopeptide (TPR) repeat protein